LSKPKTPPKQTRFALMPNSLIDTLENLISGGEGIRTLVQTQD
jgi:hypothetical protein